MSFKTILVQIDESRHADARIELASKIAAAENAHLIGAAMTGVSRYLFEAMSVAPMDPDVMPYVETLRQRGYATLDKFEAATRQFNVMSAEKRLIDDEPVAGVSLLARYCDLVVLGQTDRDDPAALGPLDLPESIVLQSGCPALIVPYATMVRTIAKKVLIAWNASLEAKHAVFYALPFLKKANVVHVAIFNPKPQSGDTDDPPEAALRHYLGRHGIDVEVSVETTKIDVGSAMLSLAATLDSDLIVMGCYGHSRFREVLTGGTTRTMLASMTIPVLMAH